jgi:hypothetical protein
MQQGFLALLTARVAVRGTLSDTADNSKQPPNIQKTKLKNTNFRTVI